MIPWEIKAREFVNCNCAYGCPCQFNALPTHGNCKAACGYQIDEGHFGDVKLDGLLAAGMWSWPRAIHEGNGTRQLIVPENASEAQRDALEKIMSGAETEPMSTMWSVFDACSRPAFRKAALRRTSSRNSDGRMPWGSWPSGHWRWGSGIRTGAVPPTQNVGTAPQT